ncbi:alpha/beta hydrolase [soil metagenome]
MTDPFLIRDHVADYPRYAPIYAERSAATRKALRQIRDIPYGHGAGETLDLYFPAPEDGVKRPIHLFIHGGYWRAHSKDDYAFVADTVTAAGAIAAIVDYSLMPGARMAVLIDEVRGAAAWLRDNAGSFGGNPERFTASGHSAGGHLTAMLAASGASGLAAAMPVSGMFDLKPLTKSFLQAEISLSDDEVEKFSPVNLPGDASVSYVLVAGAAETAPFRDQAQDYATHLALAGIKPRTIMVPGEDHMSIILSLGTPGSETANLLTELISDH